MSRPSAWRRWRGPVVGLVIVVALTGVAPRAAAAQAVTGDSVRVHLTFRVPAMAATRRIAPAAVARLPDGRHELSFAVTVAANCEWTLGVRRRGLWRTRLTVPMEVEDADGRRPEGRRPHSRVSRRQIL